MSTSNSHLWKLQEEARRMAHHLKRPNVLPNKPTIKFGIAMDDKLVTIDMARSLILKTSEDALAAIILREMKGETQQ